MSTRIRSWQIVGSELRDVETSLVDTGRLEATHLESWLEAEPEIIGEDLVILGRQVQTQSGPLDLLAIDRSGALVVVELKRDRLPRAVLAQAIDYASDIGTWSLEKVGEVCARHTDRDLEELLSEEFPEVDLDHLRINDSQRIVLVGFSAEESLERMVSWLSTAYGMDVNVVILHYTRTSGGEELLSRTVLIPEEVVEKRSRAKKFTIPTSDEPGTYEEDELAELLGRYLRRDLKTAGWIRAILIPLALEHDTVTRDQIKQRLVEAGEAEDLQKAGFKLTTISNQLGMEKNDFLRQVIGYSYPNYEWEKDNYFIRNEVRDLLQEVLRKIGQRGKEV